MTRHDVVVAVSVVPDLSLAILAIITWVDPERFGTHLIGFFVFVAITEIVVVHSAGFLGAVAYSDKPRATRAWHTLGISASYSVTLAAFCIAFESWLPLLGFWFQMVNRLLGVLLGQAPDGEERELVRMGWITNSIFCVVALFVAFVPGLPWLGVRPGMLGRIDGIGGDDWLEEPHRALFFSAVYFSLAAIAGLFSHEVPGRKKERGAKRSVTNRRSRG